MQLESAELVSGKRDAGAQMVPRLLSLSSAFSASFLCYLHVPIALSSPLVKEFLDPNNSNASHGMHLDQTHWLKPSKATVYKPAWPKLAQKGALCFPGYQQVKANPTFHSHLKIQLQSSRLGAGEMNLTRNHEVSGSIPGLAQWVKDPVLP